jgi:hypothetical protein
MDSYPLSASFPEERDISQMRFPKKSDLELPFSFPGLLLFLTVSFLLPLLLCLDFLHRYVGGVPINTRMRFVDT